MSVGCSLADDLQSEEEADDEAATQPAAATSPSSTSPICHITRLSTTSSPAFTDDAVEPYDADGADEPHPVLHANDPLACYLQQLHIGPLHTLPALQPLHWDDETEKTDRPLQSTSTPTSPTLKLPGSDADDAEASPPYRRARLWALPTLCWLLCPALVGCISAASAADEEEWPVELTRAQWRFRCHRCDGRSPSRVAAPPSVDAPPALLFPLLRFALLLQSTALLAVLSMMVTACIAYVLSASCPLDITAVHLLVYPAVLFLLFLNWLAAYRQLRESFMSQASQSAVLSLQASTASTIRLVRTVIRRVMEAEVVSKGYYLPLNSAHAVTMDHRQAARMRQAIALRHSAFDTLQRLIIALTDAITALRRSQSGEAGDKVQLGEVVHTLWSCADVWSELHLAARVQSAHSSSSTPSMPPEPPETPSIAQLQGLQGQVELLHSSLWAQLSSLASSARADVQLLHSTLTRLSSFSADSVSQLQLALCMHNPATSSSAQPSLSVPPASASSLLRIHHRLRSAQVRLLLSFQRGPSPSSRGKDAAAGASDDQRSLILSDLQYIQRAVQDIRVTCSELEREMNWTKGQSEEKEDDPSLHPTPPSRGGADGADSLLPSADGRQSSVLAEMLGLRRRKAAVDDGGGLLFEGEGLWKEGGGGSDEEESSGVERSRRQQRMAGARAQAVSGPSIIAVSCSMVNELKSVLSHRPTPTFHTVEAGGA